mmetsp:Transcript_10571/g.13395  ORF Transcript_10571/g.13395 Transcript_10571/m.13395 type:complete len:115 (+) Transcript_10571:552-896(+)
MFCIACPYIKMFFGGHSVTMEGCFIPGVYGANDCGLTALEIIQRALVVSISISLALSLSFLVSLPTLAEFVDYVLGCVEGESDEVGIRFFCLCFIVDGLQNKKGALRPMSNGCV